MGENARVPGCGSGTSANKARCEENPDTRACRYTIVLNSFKRHDLLQAAVAHYGACAEADAIRVIWSENAAGPPPPEHDAAFYGVPGGARVQYDVQQSSSLNNRFRPLPGLRTLAVLSIDDDIRYSCMEGLMDGGKWPR